MKSLTLSVFLLALLPLAVSGQDYKPLIEDGKVWYELSSGGFSDETYSYFLDGDTVIAGDKYRKLYTTRFSLKGAVYYGAIREEGCKVYTYLEKSTGCTLVYDFSLQPGDQVEVFPYTCLEPKYGDDVIDMTLQLDRIEKVDCFGVERRLFHLSYVHPSLPEMEDCDVCWLEGVGCLNASGLGFFFSGPFSVYGAMSAIIACTKDGKPVYGDALPSSVTSLRAGSHTPACDIHGRRLDSVPERGMYIEDGKVKVVR